MSRDKKDLFLHHWRILAKDMQEPVSEYGFDKHLGRRHRFDFAWLVPMVAVEIDGNAWQTRGGGRHGSDADREKLNLAVSMGWRVFRLSPQMVECDPDRWIAMVKAAIMEAK